ncbi:ECF-type sigma factor [Marinicella sp. S1101]|uniref:ECF-type sigma factor n=1 Tax=Marinicella marina TaxID=2996016 RepID=UPI002260CC43|nr:ECF-type sigma factor [Marinicella marina]MCX7553115.1 ECF-type sigma factor [Marinicella marina]MDJ1138847.1 ECF-type sigma factor [Marinicella marina]
MDAHQQTRSEVTALLMHANLDDEAQQNQLLNLIYVELRRMAQAKMHHERNNHTLTPTALVHEAYLRLINQDELSWQSKRHFFGAVAESMRRILIESARAKATLKRGANARHTSDLDLAIESDENELIALDLALTELEQKDAIMSEVVKLRFFSGLSVAQTAQAMNLSPRSINRQWTQARAWLIAHMR